MKKKTKIIASVAAGVLFAASLTLNVYLLARTSNMSGSIFGGNVNDAWNKTEVNIPINQVRYEACYSANSGDYINKIFFEKFYDGSMDINYCLYFNIFDDLQTYFVFDNGYTTSIETSHWLGGGDFIEVSKEDTETYDLLHHNITEVWVRTID